MALGGEIRNAQGETHPAIRIERQMPQAKANRMRVSHHMCGFMVGIFMAYGESPNACDMATV